MHHVDMARQPASLGTRIRRARERKRMKRPELAAAVGVSLKTVDNWENDRTHPRDALGALEELLEVDLSAEEPPPPPRLSEETKALMREELGPELAAQLIAHAEHLASGRLPPAAQGGPAGESGTTARRSAG